MNEEQLYAALYEARRNDPSICVSEEPSDPGHGPYPVLRARYDSRERTSQRDDRRATMNDVWDLALGKAENTWFWWHQGLCVRAGSERPDVERLLAPHGARSVEALPLVLIRGGFGGRNPWRLREEWNELAGKPESGGLPCARMYAEWQRRVLEPSRHARPIAISHGGAGRAREVLRAASVRPLSLAAEEAHLAFRLREAIRAPILAFETHTQDEVVHAVASMGAGRLLRFFGMRFPHEQPASGLWLDGAFDYGDLRIWTFESSDRVLEGTPRAAVLRRRSEAARAEYEDDCDFDDDDAGRGTAGRPSTTGNPSGGGRSNNPR